MLVYLVYIFILIFLPQAASAPRHGSRDKLLRVGGPSGALPGATGLTPTAVAASASAASAAVVELAVTKSVAVQPPAMLHVPTPSSDRTPLLPRGGGAGANGYGSSQS